MPYRKVMEGLTAAVRSGSRDRLRDELREMILEGLDGWRRDDRDLQMALAPYRVGAARMGIDPGELFTEVAAEVPEDLAPLVRQFGERSDVTPSTFGFYVRDTPDGPSFEFDATSDEELEAFIQRMRDGQKGG